ncbi:hypothetical protein DIPPA_20175 [Diplonema papillatum]|nr:hypothetical protein DIPPA_20175 [Diplonema papillatum]
MHPLPRWYKRSEFTNKYAAKLKELLEEDLGEPDPEAPPAPHAHHYHHHARKKPTRPRTSAPAPGLAREAAAPRFEPARGSPARSASRAPARRRAGTSGGTWFRAESRGQVNPGDWRKSRQ